MTRIRKFILILALTFCFLLLVPMVQAGDKVSVSTENLYLGGTFLVKN